MADEFVYLANGKTIEQALQSSNDLDVFKTNHSVQANKGAYVWFEESDALALINCQQQGAKMEKGMRTVRYVGFEAYPQEHNQNQ